MMENHWKVSLEVDGLKSRTGEEIDNILNPDEIFRFIRAIRRLQRIVNAKILQQDEVENHDSGGSTISLQI